MPHITAQVANLTQIGPVLDVAITPTQSLAQQLQRKNQAVPAPVRVTALIDTGASGTVLTPAILQQLGVQPVGIVSMSTPSTTQPVPAAQYMVNVVFPNRVVVPNVVVMEAPLGGQNIQCLIGRDILSAGVLVYLGHTNQFTISF
jgi:hypothetical protein